MELTEKDLRIFLKRLSGLISMLMREKKEQASMALGASSPESKAQYEARADELRHWIDRFRDLEDKLMQKSIDDWTDSLGEAVKAMESATSEIKKADKRLEGIIKKGQTFTELLGHLAKIVGIAITLL